MAGLTMTRDDIERMAREAGLERDGYWEFDMQRLERFAALVATAEREACAKLCERDELLHYDPVVTADKCAAAIRERGQQ